MTKNSSINIDATLQRIAKLIENKLLQQAAKQLNLLKTKAPNDARLFLLASTMANAANNPDGALAAAQKAYTLAPGWHVTSIYLAEMFAARGNRTDAIPLANQAILQATELGRLDTALLHKAATVAYQLADYANAQQWLEQALSLEPADSSALYKLGLTQSTLGNLENAIASFTRLLDTMPANHAVRYARLRTAVAHGQMALAEEDSKALLAQDPGNAQYKFYLAVAQGIVPETLPATVVQEQFVGIANTYDQTMVVDQKYRLPRDIAERIQQWHPDRKQDILDLGCGTGLLGSYLGPQEGVVVGVDLSEPMIAQASRRGVYDKFHQVNLLDALEATPGDLYHVITALDVLPYVGNLQTVMPNAYRILLPGGRLIVSCETAAEAGPDFTLNRQLSYQHKPGYVRQLLETTGFTDIVFEDVDLRVDSGVAVPGFVATAQKPTGAATKKTVRKSTKSAKPVPN